MIAHTEINIGTLSEFKISHDLFLQFSFIKKDIFTQVMNAATTQEDAIVLLQSGGFKLKKADFDKAMAEFKPSSKKDIMDAIDKWERNLSNDSYLIDDDDE